MDQRIQFLITGDGVRLAYSVAGSGPPLLKTANWRNHLEFDWNSPVWQHWFALFAARHRFYRYGIRGSGLSDRVDTGLDFSTQASEAQVSWINELQRCTTTPEIAARILKAFGSTEVSGRMGAVEAPTLVMHSRRDDMVPFNHGRILAAGIPQAQFVEFESDNHILIESEPAWQRFQEVGEFLGWMRDAPQPNDGLAMLTAREREIPDLVASGASNLEIGTKLFISEETVRNHLTAIFDKLDVTSRSQAIVFARDRGVAGRPY